MSTGLKVVVCLGLLQALCAVSSNGQFAGQPFIGGRVGHALGLDKLFDDPMSLRQMMMLSSLLRSYQNGAGQRGTTSGGSQGTRPRGINYMALSSLLAPIDF